MIRRMAAHSLENVYGRAARSEAAFFCDAETRES